MKRVRISIEISVRMKILIVLVLIAAELIFNVLPRGEASAWLLILVFIWTMTERHKERREAVPSEVLLPSGSPCPPAMPANKAPVEAEEAREEVEDESNNVDTINDAPNDSGLDRGDQQDPGGLPDGGSVDPRDSNVDGGSEEVVAAVIATTGSEDGDILAQAVGVIKTSIEQQGPLRASAVDPVGVIRKVLVKEFGIAWEEASFAHFHALSGSCIFVAITTLHQDKNYATVACRVIEIDSKGNLVIPSAVPVVEEGKEE